MTGHRGGPSPARRGLRNEPHRLQSLKQSKDCRPGQTAPLSNLLRCHTVLLVDCFEYLQAALQSAHRLVNGHLNVSIRRQPVCVAFHQWPEKRPTLWGRYTGCLLPFNCFVQQVNTAHTDVFTVNGAPAFILSGNGFALSVRTVASQLTVRMARNRFPWLDPARCHKPSTGQCRSSVSGPTRSFGALSGNRPARKRCSTTCSSRPTKSIRI